MKPVIFIDGREGTTGLQIYDRLTPRQDIELLLIDEEKRKDPAERKKCLNAADLVFLCLPDEAAREAVAMIDNPNTRVIDASTAHRTAPGWDYGFPELSPHHRARIVCSKRVANPGCHASGFIASVYPLVQLGLIPPDHPLCAYSLTGYSGGGKKLIAEYQDPHRDPRHASTAPISTTSICRRWSTSAVWPPRRSSTPSWGTISRAWPPPSCSATTPCPAAPPPKRSTRRCPAIMRGKPLSPWRLLAEMCL